jgi:hypothetical protein
VPVGVNEGTVVEEIYEMDVQTRGVSDKMRRGLFKLVSRCGGVSLD